MPIINQNLSNIQVATIENLVLQFKELFTEPDHFGQVRNFKHRIILKEDSQPFSRPPYRTSPKEREIINSEIAKLLDAKLIRTSNSPYSSP